MDAIGLVNYTASKEKAPEGAFFYEQVSVVQG
jgi:hypothetical protein